jgi:hypothetical protein
MDPKRRVPASTFVDILANQRLVELAKRVRMRVADL